MGKWSYRIPSTDYWSHIYVFDIETEPITDPDDPKAQMKAEFVFGVIYTGTEFFRFEDRELMKAEMQRLSNAGLIGVAHNMEFDLVRIFGNVISNSTKYIYRHRFLYAHLKRQTKYDKVLRFTDSMNLFPISLREVGAVVGIPKGEGDYINYAKGMTVREEDWQYCEQDCRIVWEAVKMFRSIMRERFAMDPCLTLASTAFKYTIPMLMEAVGGTFNEKMRRWEMDIDDTLQAWAKEGYRGGMVRALEKGVTEGPLYYYDVNSSYPWSMTQPFPDPRYGWEIQEPEEEDIEEALRDREGFARIRVQRCRGRHPYVGVKIDNQVYHPRNEEFETVITFPELRFLRDHPEDYDYEVLGLVCSYRIDSPFILFVTEMYDLKRSSKRDNPGLSYSAKIMLNSCYGKFQQKNYEERYIADVEEYFEQLREDCADLNEFETRSKAMMAYWNPLGDGDQGYIRTPEREAPHVMYCIGAYITGRSRTLLWSRIHDAVYCDTDSLVLPYQIATSSELGGWKQEYLLDRLDVAGKKWYKMWIQGGEVKSRIKGVSLLTMDIDIRDPQEMRRMMKSREALRRGMDAGDFIYVIKYLRDVNDEVLP